MIIEPANLLQNKVFHPMADKRAGEEKSEETPFETISIGGGRDFSRKVYMGAELSSLLADSKIAEASGEADAGRTGTEAPVRREFGVEGAAERGFYKRITGEGVRLEMTREPHYVDIGGICIEANPSYSITGECSNEPVELSVTLEDHIASVGGINIQTGTTYHVKGKVGGRDIKADITHEDEIHNLGGINVQTACRAHMKGVEGSSPDLTVERVSVIESAGGFNVETDSYDTVTGSDLSGAVDVRARGLTSGDSVTIEGAIPGDTLALVLGLKPFLYAA